MAQWIKCSWPRVRTWVWSLRTQKQASVTNSSALTGRLGRETGETPEACVPDHQKYTALGREKETMSQVRREAKTYIGSCLLIWVSRYLWVCAHTHKHTHSHPCVCAHTHTYTHTHFQDVTIFILWQEQTLKERQNNNNKTKTILKNVGTAGNKQSKTITKKTPLSWNRTNYYRQFKRRQEFTLSCVSYTHEAEVSNP